MIERTASSGDTWRVGSCFEVRLMPLPKPNISSVPRLRFKRSIRAAAFLDAKSSRGLRSGIEPENYRMLRTGCSGRRDLRHLRMQHIGGPKGDPARDRAPQRLLWYPSLYEGFEYSRTSSIPAPRRTRTAFRWPNISFAPTASAYFRRVDYVYPRESNRIMRDLIVSYGGEIAGEIYVPWKRRTRICAPFSAR